MLLCMCSSFLFYFFLQIIWLSSQNFHCLAGFWVCLRLSDLFFELGVCIFLSCKCPILNQKCWSGVYLCIIHCFSSIFGLFIHESFGCQDILFHPMLFWGIVSPPQYVVLNIPRWLLALFSCRTNNNSNCASLLVYACVCVSVNCFLRNISLEVSFDWNVVKVYRS